MNDSTDGIHDLKNPGNSTQQAGEPGTLLGIAVPLHVIVFQDRQPERFYKMGAAAGKGRADACHEDLR